MVVIVVYTKYAAMASVSAPKVGQTPPTLLASTTLLAPSSSSDLPRVVLTGSKVYVSTVLVVVMLVVTVLVVAVLVVVVLVVTLIVGQICVESLQAVALPWAANNAAMQGNQSNIRDREKNDTAFLVHMLTQAYAILLIHNR